MRLPDSNTQVVRTKDDAAGRWLKATLLVAVLLLIGIPIGLMHPAFIDQDTYQYLSIANYYLLAPHWHIRDVYTVGPVIPILIAAGKWMAGIFTTWSPDVDVAVLKGLSFACYTTIVLAAAAYHRRKNASFQATGLFIGILLFTLPAESATLSVNGELVCSALMATLLAIGATEAPSPLRVVTLIAVSVLVVYTKIQAILLLLLCLMMAFNGVARLRILVLFGAAISGTEAVLFFVGGGWVERVSALVRYVLIGHRTGNTSGWSIGRGYNFVAEQLSHVCWLATHTLWYFPVALTTIALAAAVRRSSTAPRKALGLWIATTAVTILLPGRTFDHYLLFFIPVILLFSADALNVLHISTPPKSVALGGLAALVIVKFTAMMPVAELFSSDRILHLIPRQFISDQAAELKARLPTDKTDTMFIHGWDYRYYSYFNEAYDGPELWLVKYGNITAETYIDELIAKKPTFILDVVDHSGVLRDPGLSLSAVPLWRLEVANEYDKVFEQDGLVAYQLKSTPAVELHIPAGILR